MSVDGMHYTKLYRIRKDPPYKTLQISKHDVKYGSSDVTKYATNVTSAISTDLSGSKNI